LAPGKKVSKQTQLAGGEGRRKNINQGNIKAHTRRTNLKKLRLFQGERSFSLVDIHSEKIKIRAMERRIFSKKGPGKSEQKKPDQPSAMIGKMQI